VPRLQNLSIYPSHYTTSVSSGTLDWASVDFQVIGESRKHVWEFKGAGTSTAESVRITYTVKTTTNITFEGFVTGTITTDDRPTAMNGTLYAFIGHGSANDTTTITITISGLGRLGGYGYTLYYNDAGCNYNTMAPGCLYFGEQNS
jgi:hypothetical protein